MLLSVDAAIVTLPEELSRTQDKDVTDPSEADRSIFRFFRGEIPRCQDMSMLQ